MSTSSSVVLAGLLVALPVLAGTPATDSSATRDTVAELSRTVVTAQRPNAGVEINVDRAEQSAGIKEDLGSLIYLQPGVERIPEAGSALLINGQGLYDSRHVVFGVPMMSASHFTNHSFCDRSGILVPSVDRMSLHTRDLAGLFSDAPGGVVVVDPGVARIANPRWKKRPELVVNIGTLNSDVLLSVPVRKNMYQLSSRWAYDKLIDQKSWALSIDPENSLEDAALGYAVPASFGDVILTGENTLGSLAAQEYAWFAYDVFGSSAHTDSAVVPWGMGALRLSDTGSARFSSVDIGGSHQPYFEGKRLGMVMPLKDIRRTNAVARYTSELRSPDPWRFDAGLSIEGLNWTGTLDQRWARRYDWWWRYDSLVTRSVEGKEVRVEGRANARRVAGVVHFGGNALMGLILPECRWYLDPGLWSRLVHQRATMELRGGIQTSQPDIRGLPSTSYRNRLDKTYSADLSSVWNAGHPLALEGAAFLRYRDRCPAISRRPWEPIWDPREETALFSRGVNCKLSLNALTWLEASTIQQFSMSRRVAHGSESTYEWDQPWSNKSILHFRTMEDRTHVYVIGIFAAGLPYPELRMLGDSLYYEPKLYRTPDYKRVDLLIQFNQDIGYHRYLTRFDMYVELTNVLNFIYAFSTDHNTVWANPREYFWDEYMNKSPIFLDYYRFTIGGRLGFRL